MIGTYKQTERIVQPKFAHYLFDSTASAWFWLVVRLYVGYEWLLAGYEKFENPAWVGNGSALLGFWKGAVAVPAAPAKAAITFDWYRGFLQFLIDSGSAPVFAKLITFGEMAVGLGLIVGAFVGIAAFFGALMNMNFMLAGSASTNPVLFFLAVGMILAWKVAGYYGLDRVILPSLGTPWQAGVLTERHHHGTAAATPAAG